MSDKPICKVNGRLAPGVMCGLVVVGGKHCGFDGACEHKGVTGQPLRLSALLCC
jgi:hypothetical protein